MSSYHTICSNALHQTNYRPTPPASLLPKLLHHQLPYYTSHYTDSSISSAVPNVDPTMQPFSSRFIHVFPQAANESSFGDTFVIECMSNALLCCLLSLPRAPKNSSHQSVLSLRHNPVTTCASMPRAAPTSLPFSYDTTPETESPV